MQNEWKPNNKEDLADGEAIHHLLYKQGDINTPEGWCYQSTSLLLDIAIVEIQRCLDIIKYKPPHERILNIVDYGAGSGFASIELIKKMKQKQLFSVFNDFNINFNLYLLDFPSGWFAKGYYLLQEHPFIKFLSIRNPSTGKILSLYHLFGAIKIDIIIANMVLHLIPLKVLPSLIDDFAQVLKSQGSFLWNSPDTAPAPSDALLIHDPNRVMRKLALSLINDKDKLLNFFELIPMDIRSQYSELIKHLSQININLSSSKRVEAENAANKQILKNPHPVRCIVEILEKSFLQGNIFASNTHITSNDLLKLISMPSNQKYLMEIEDPEMRKDFILLLMKFNILPKFCNYNKEQGTYANLHWISGKYRKIK
jgi:hypothetical protein